MDDSPNAIGTAEVPLESTEPMMLARACLLGRFHTPKGMQTLYEYRQAFWHWHEGRWRLRDLRWVEDEVIKWLADAHVRWTSKDGEGVKRLGPTKTLILDVVRLMRALVVLEDRRRLPLWLGPVEEEPTPVGSVVAFEDRLVNCVTGEVRERDARWFDHAVVRVDYDPDAECPRWMRCLGEWSEGDEVWKELLARVMGYALMGKREYAKWVLFQGVIRGGKGVILGVLEDLVGPDAYFGTTLNDLAGPFGLDGVQHSRVLAIGEMSEMAGADAERAARVIKGMVGRDKVPVQVKYRRQPRGQVLDCLPILLSNEIPVLPNKGRGLSSKMLVLPFRVSFRDREDFVLPETLKGEIAGIAAWAVRGAMRLEAETDPSRKFVMPEGARERIRAYYIQNHAMDAFLEARFTENPEGFVGSELLWKQFCDWRGRNNVAMKMSRNMLNAELEQKSSWPIQRGRLGSGGKRGMRGLSLRREFDDEI